MKKRTRRMLSVVSVWMLGLVLALTAFGGNSNFPNHTGNVRLDAPDDPNFDRAEPDDSDSPTNSGYIPGLSVFQEQFNLFSFAPAATRNTAIYKDAARAGQPQISGTSVDLAWEKSIGDPKVVIAILDTGIDWTNENLRRKIFLNCGELPAPQRADSSVTACPAGDPICSPGCLQPTLVYDLNGNGAVDVEDYINDPRVDKNGGKNGVPNEIDAEDLIVAFSDGIDHDHNGYVNDIAGWDFFENDNDPFDDSSYSSAHLHGSGRASDAAAETNDGRAGAGVCPRCRIAPLRIWDSFVPDSNNWAQATAYAADNGFKVTENALGNVYNSRFAREAAAYAIAKGVTIMSVSSDLDTANHNYPTNYDDMIYVAGIVADSQSGLGSLSPVPGLPYNTPLLTLGFNPPVTTWFRNSNVTQYGGHNHISMMADTGSFATGQAAGAAGLLISAANQAGTGPLRPNEVKQLLTLTAEDVTPENTVGIGDPDPSQPGWDQHFGYGRVNLAAAVAAVQAPDKIPAVARITNPPWFGVIDPSRHHALDISGEVSAPRANSFTYQVQIAAGIEPLDSQFETFASGGGSSTIAGALATIPMARLKRAFPPLTDFSAAPGAKGPPLQGDAHVPSNQFMFTVRLRVTDNNGRVSEDRRSLFLHHDPTIRAGWPLFLNTGGEQALKIADLNHDHHNQLIDATSSGLLYVFNADGTPLASFNGGNPVSVSGPANLHPGAPVYSIVAPPNAAMTTPAIGDLDNSGIRREIVVGAADKIYVFEPDGSLRPGFPVTLNPAFTDAAMPGAVATATQLNYSNHLKRGILAAPALGDLDGDGKLEIVVAALDQRVYAWHADGSPVKGFPVLARDPNATSPIGAELINTPALGKLDGIGELEIVVGSNEVYPPNGSAEMQNLMAALNNPFGLPAALQSAPLEQAFASAGKSSRVYAIHSDGFCHGISGCSGVDAHPFAPSANAFLAGWPVTLNGLTPDVLPLVGPGFTAAIANVDNDPTTLEVITGISTGNIVVLRSDGTRLATMASAPFGALSDTLDQSAALNLFEYPVVANLTGSGRPTIIKGGITLNGLLNLVLEGQNLPFNHVIQAWDAASGEYLPAFPKSTDDYMPLGQPAVADVGSAVAGVADGRPEIIAGTGMYLLHAYNQAGQEPARWPKLLGGWIAGTPAVGDLDGDGKVEVAAATREGYVFVFKTDGRADTNNQWWGFHHDEWNSGNVTVDPRN